MDDKSYFLDLLQRLVAIPSQSQNEQEAAAFLAQLLGEELGMDPQLQQVGERGANVVAVLQGSRGGSKKILLGGHIDTVTVAEGWTSDPFQLTVKEDLAYGLGAADMKGGLAAQITVMKRLIDEGCAFSGAIEFVVLCDEERHSLGANAYVKWKKEGGERGERPADFALLAEPHYTNIVVGATGKVLLRLVVTGESGHGAKPETGVNAIDCMNELLYAINRKYTPLYEKGLAASHCVLQIESRYEGYSLNIPEKCTALLNRQLYAHEKAEEFVGDLQEIYKRVVGRGNLAIQREIPYYPSYTLDQTNVEFQRLLLLLKERYGHEPELLVNQSVSDGNILFAELGIPTVLFGPEGCDYHKSNEFLRISSACEYMEMLHDFIISRV